jgi:hypothetical protein
VKPDLPYSVPRPSGLTDAEYIRHLWKEANKQRTNAGFLRGIMEETLAEADRIEALAAAMEKKQP